MHSKGINISGEVSRLHQNVAAWSASALQVQSRIHPLVGSSPSSQQKPANTDNPRPPPIETSHTKQNLYKRQKTNSPKPFCLPIPFPKLLYSNKPQCANQPPTTSSRTSQNANITSTSKAASAQALSSLWPLRTTSICHHHLKMSLTLRPRHSQNGTRISRT